MTSVIVWASIILILEIRTLYTYFKVPDELQDKEKTDLLDFLNQMRSYLGISTFKNIAITSSIIINGIYILYFLSSCFSIDIQIYKIISIYMIIERIFKVLETFELNFDKIDYIVGSDVVIRLRNLIVLAHVFVTIILLIIHPIF